MPIYEYRCGKCGFQKEFLQRMSDAPLTDCPKCGKRSFSKMVTAAGFQLKGTGWYATDFKSSGAKPVAKQEIRIEIRNRRHEAKTEAKTETKAEAKTERNPHEVRNQPGQACRTAPARNRPRRQPPFRPAVTARAARRPAPRRGHSPAPNRAFMLIRRHAPVVRCQSMTKKASSATSSPGS